MSGLWQNAVHYTLKLLNLLLQTHILGKSLKKNVTVVILAYLPGPKQRRILI